MNISKYTACIVALVCSLMLGLAPAAHAQFCLACGLNGLGNAMQNMGQMLMQQELQKELLEQQYQQQLQLQQQQQQFQLEQQRQHDLDMQRLQQQQQQPPQQQPQRDAQ